MPRWLFNFSGHRSCKIKVIILAVCFLIILFIAGCTKVQQPTLKNADAYLNRGTAWFDKGDYDRAISDLNKAIEINPKLAEAYLNRGVAWGNKGDYDRSISDCNKAIEVNPKYALAYYNRGLAWIDKGDYSR
ncbi:tetratricopeptide repeat protein, partial [bacterium]|nr:tetratricopeptide repeat protein [bacterium]